MLEIKEYVLNKKVDISKKLSQVAGKPDIAIIQVGDVEASNKYVKNKIKDCNECGIACALFKFDENISEDKLLEAIEYLNNHPTVVGFIVQLPLPWHIDEQKVMSRISPEKDLDGFNKLSKTVPATPLGIYNYLKDMHFDFEGKNAVIIGRSDIVGKPMAKLLLKENMNTTVLHSKTSDADKRYYLKNADLIIVATGHLETLNNTYEFKKTAVIFDVGINVDEQGKLQGDCEKNLSVAFQSPVPGGVGLLTRVALMENVLKLLNIC